MPGFTRLLRQNRNYRYTWMGQVVSEIGDHFNNIAVFSLVLETTGSGAVITGVMLSRAIAFVVAGPLAGVLLDRADRRRIMIASALVRAVVAVGFIAGSPVRGRVGAEVPCPTIAARRHEPAVGRT